MPLNTGAPITVATGIVIPTIHHFDPITVTATTKPVNPQMSCTFSHGLLAEYLTYNDIVWWMIPDVISFAGGANTVNYSVEINGVELDTGVLSSGGSTGWKAKAAAISEATPTVPIDLLVEVFFWVNAGSCIIGSSEHVTSVWAGPGCIGATASGSELFKALQAQLLLGLRVNGLTSGNEAKDTLEIDVYYYDDSIGLFQTILDLVGGTNAGYVMSFVPTAVGTPIQAQIPIEVDWWSNDGPTCFVYYLTGGFVVFENR